MRIRVTCMAVLIVLTTPVCGLAPLPTGWTEVAIVATDCDERLWGHTYFAEERLTTVAECIVVEGIVRETHMADDADLIIELQTDPRLINDKNKHGWLKVEAVCQGTGTQDKHRIACRGYPGPRFGMPRVGALVRVTGRYVSDRDHGGWMEIHPLSQLELID